jgi:tRNA A-37 threonylcarbamoyl transferase component Bud32
MEAALIVFIIFGSITIWVRGFPSLLNAARGRGKERELRRELDAGTQKLRALSEQNQRYEDRLRTLEGIVCDVDYELNRKLARLATLNLSAQQVAAAQATQSGLHDGAAAAAAQRGEPPASTATATDGRVVKRPPAVRGLLEAGMRVADRFVIEDALGSGAMAEVYAAYDEKLEETVALKVMAGVSLMEPDAIERFKREASAVRRIRHPNVVQLHDMFVDRGIHMLSMEYVHGESLRQVLEREVALHLSDVRFITEQVCDALEAAHAAGVVHRDLKPDNILIDAEDQVRVIDFGVAKVATLSGLTMTGVVMGTPEYMAPEQMRGKDVDGRSDLYSLGAVVFHMLAGKPPFTGDSPIAVGLAQCTDPLPDLGDFRELPASWVKFVERAMSKRPDERFATAAEMRAALPEAAQQAGKPRFAPAVGGR